MLKVNGHRTKVLTKEYNLILVPQLHLREFLDPGFIILFLILNAAQKKLLCVGHQFEFMLFVYIFDEFVCTHKYRNSTRVKKRSFIVILVWSTILKPYVQSLKLDL